MQKELKEIKTFLRKNKIKFRLHFNDKRVEKKQAVAMAFCPESRIWCYFGRNASVDTIISYILHEACHVFYYREGKFKDYHACYSYNELTRKRARAIIRTAARAENATEDRAEKLLKKMYPKMKYDRYYNKKTTDLHLMKLRYQLREFL